jgi:anti-sigma B factor antagonist
VRLFQLFRRRPGKPTARISETAPLGISHEPLGDGGWLFTVEGELDLASADRLREALAAPIRNGAAGIVLDLARCPFVDSSGLAVMIEAQRTLTDSSTHPRFAILTPAPQPRRLLSMTSVDTVLPVVESRGEAQAAIDGPREASSSPR